MTDPGGIRLGVILSEGNTHDSKKFESLLGGGTSNQGPWPGQTTPKPRRITC